MLGMLSPEFAARVLLGESGLAICVTEMTVELVRICSNVYAPFVHRDDVEILFSLGRPVPSADYSYVGVAADLRVGLLHHFDSLTGRYRNCVLCRWMGR